MIEQYAQSLAQFLQSNPHWGGVITFFISFLESLAVVGTIIPGSVTMTAVGMLIGSAILPFTGTLIWATIGAFLGDLLGYWLGSYYNERLRKMWPFKKHPQWLEAGESFFHKHGGKSILIGRFIGPLRSIIPMIAGLLHMPWQKFVLAALPAACLWAIAYMLPGILIGALSMQLPANVATRFILILLAIVILLSLFAWLITIFSSKVRNLCRHFLKKLWRQLQSQKKYDWLTSRIANKDHPSDYHQLGWLILSIIMFILFLIISMNVFQHTELTSFNRPLFEFLRSIRNAKTDRVMIGITLLGDGRVLSISSIMILLWLFFHKNYRAFTHWVLTIGIGLLIPNLFKYFLYFPRPTGLLHASSTSSFPSGHTFLSFMFYGFLSAFLATHIKKRFRRYIYYFAGAIIFLVAFSRLYLGAHWLSDVLASACLGYCFLSLIILSYRRKVFPIKTAQFFLFTLTITFVIWACYFALSYQKNLKRYSLDWPSQVIDQTLWWGRLNPALPTYRQNRLGKPAEPMNLQFSGDVQQVKKILISKGWTANPDMTLLSNTIQKLSPDNEPSFTPFLPSLYLNKKPLLFMVKDTHQSKLILKLWTSNVYLAESWDVLYIGNIVEYHIDKKRKKITYSYNVINHLEPYFYPNAWRIRIIQVPQIPTTLFNQKWNGEILQISAPALY